MVAGGRFYGQMLATVVLYDPTSNSWSLTEPLSPGRASLSLDRLPSGELLAAGGETGSQQPVVVAELFGLIKGNSACSVDGECFSTHCVDGVCCDQACDQPCTACSAAAKTYGVDGVCEVVAAGFDPHQDCDDSGSPSCQENGSCDGAGSCQMYPVQKDCQAENCSDAQQCASGYCADGICCDAACEAGCRACTAELKGAGQDGLCEPIVAGDDPKAACLPDSAPCLADGHCDGLGACRLYALSGTSCAATTCSEDGALASSECDGQGQCDSISTSCAPYLCADSSCTTSCQQDADCAVGRWCTSGQCLDKAAHGSVCVEPRSCLSEKCVDGLCCVQDDCAPYRCSLTGQCRESCESSAHCGAGWVCDRHDKCVPKKTIVVARGAVWSWSVLWWVGLLGLLALRKRSRDSRSARS